MAQKKSELKYYFFSIFGSNKLIPNWLIYDWSFIQWKDWIILEQMEEQW